MPTQKATYGTPGVLSLRPAIGTPGTDGYQEAIYVIRDRPDRKEDVELHQDEAFSVYTSGRWVDAYVDYSGKTPVVRRSSSNAALILSGQIHARLRLI